MTKAGGGCGALECQNIFYFLRVHVRFFGQNEFLVYNRLFYPSTMVNFHIESKINENCFERTKF